MRQPFFFSAFHGSYYLSELEKPRVKVVKVEVVKVKAVRVLYTSH